MPVSKKQQACVDRYKSLHYDLVRLNVAKGGKDAIRAAADLHGQSVNAYLIDVIRAALERDGIRLPDRPGDAAEAEAQEETEGGGIQ